MKSPAPMSQCSALAEMPLLQQRTKNVRDRLVERTRLAGVGEAALMLRDAVCELVPDHVQTCREIAENDAVAITIHHLPAVPERVVELPVVVHAREQPHAAAVD